MIGEIFQRRQRGVAISGTRRLQEMVRALELLGPHTRTDCQLTVMSGTAHKIEGS